jgi:hypothetical protein
MEFEQLVIIVASILAILIIIYIIMQGFGSVDLPTFGR